MGQYTSYWLYQKYETRGSQDPIPCYPNVYSVDGDGTMPLHIKNESDIMCGGSGGCDVRYDWVEIPISEEYICDDCDINIQFRWVGTGEYAYFGDYKYAIQMLEYKVEDNEWTTTDKIKYSTNPVETMDKKVILKMENGVEYAASVGTRDGKSYHYLSPYDEYYIFDIKNDTPTVENWNYLCPVLHFDLVVSGTNQPNHVTLVGKLVGGDNRLVSTVTSMTFGSYVTEIGNGNVYNNDDLSAPGFTTNDSHWIAPYTKRYDLSSITFSENLESIGMSCFQRNRNLKSVTFPDSLKKIGADYPTQLEPHGSVNRFDSGAFYDCGLETVYTNKVEHIGCATFAHNYYLVSARIGSACTSIDKDVFDYCLSLKQIIFEGNEVPKCYNTTFSGSTVWNFGNLPSDCKIYVPCEALDTFKNSPLTTGYTDMIYGYGGSCGELPPAPSPSDICFKIKSVSFRYQGWMQTIDDLILDDGSGVLTDNDVDMLVNIIGTRNIENIEFGTCLKTISYEAFKWQTGYINDISLNGVETIGEGAFLHTFNGTTVIIPDSVTNIGEGAFQVVSGGRNGGNINKIRIGSGITSIPNYCFDGNAKELVELDIPDNIQTIGNGAFGSCIKLGVLHIGSGITSIGSDAFSYASRLNSVTIEAIIPPTLGSNAFIGSSDYFKIYVPAESVNAYKSASRWSNYANRIQPIS